MVAGALHKRPGGEQEERRRDGEDAAPEECAGEPVRGAGGERIQSDRHDHERVHFEAEKPVETRGEVQLARREQVPEVSVGDLSVHDTHRRIEVLAEVSAEERDVVRRKQNRERDEERQRYLDAPSTTQCTGEVHGPSRYGD